MNNHNAQINEWLHSDKPNTPAGFRSFIGPLEWHPQTATEDERSYFSMNFEDLDTWGVRAKMCKYATPDFKHAWSLVVADRRRKTCDDWDPTSDNLGNREKVFHVWLTNRRLQAKTLKLLGMA
jgi:hypothetical protein